MHIKAHSHSSIFGVSWRSANGTLAIMLVLLFFIFLLLFMTLTAPPAQGQTFTVIHNFTGGADGGNPQAGLTMDTAGNLYGTTENGGYTGGRCFNGCGVVFKLKHSGSGWLFTPLHTFIGGNDGAFPKGRVAAGPDGTLYGTTILGGGTGCGGGNGCGTVFHLAPPPTAPRTALPSWNETVTYSFSGSDGNSPSGDLTFDQSGNIYGTTSNGGSAGGGVIYELTLSGASWIETVLYSAQEGGNGYYPLGGVVLDRSGNLYGVFWLGGPCNGGAVYQLSPAGAGWTEQNLHGFTCESDGATPTGGLIIDPSGNLYGTTFESGNNAAGTVFELTSTNGGWTFNTLYSFSGPGPGGPEDKLFMDAAGNLYGTTLYDDIYGWGAAFKLILSNGGWTYTSLHDFTGGSDGAAPITNLVFDANGNLYGTTSAGGAYGHGVVFEIAP